MFFHLELENKTARVLEVFEPERRGSLGGLNVYGSNPDGLWGCVYTHCYPTTLRDVLDSSRSAIRSAKTRTLLPGEKLVYRSPFFGEECRERATQGLPTLSACSPLTKPGKYRFRYDSAVSSNFVEFTVRSASLSAIAVIPRKRDADKVVSFKTRVFGDGEAYVALLSYLEGGW